MKMLKRKNPSEQIPKACNSFDLTLSFGEGRGEASYFPLPWKITMKVYNMIFTSSASEQFSI